MQEIVNDGPEDRCFGCGQRNERGLRLRFLVSEDGEVETSYTAPDELGGMAGVVHGGIQATLLDEVMGMAVARFEEQRDPERRSQAVTADLRLRYRRPVATGRPLRARARVVRVEERDAFVEGEILAEDGEVLTRAESRWRQLR